MTRKSTLRSSVVAILMTLTLLLATAPAFAAGGKGGGGKGGGGETVANNLSVPAIIIGAGAPTTNFACSLTATDPTGTPLTGYPIASTAYYFVQGIHKWQASCNNTLTTATADAAWGDNLTGDAKLKTNSPIRVEMGLLALNPTGFGMTGYTVDKLDPNALDRVSAYGTLAQQVNGVWVPATRNDAFAEVRVWVAGAALTMTSPNGNISTLNMSAEINATGRIVYGYNLRVTTAGTYVLHFTVPSAVSINSADGGVITHNADGSATISLPITILSSAGGGGGRKG